jgi:tetratricopeptide (TPR) repeat protein
MDTSKTLKSFLIITLLFCLFPLVSFCKEEEMTKQDYLNEIVTVKELLKEEPGNPMLHNTLGFYLFKIGEHSNAEEEYINAIKYDEGYSIPYNNLGVLSLIKKDYVKAEEYFTDAIDLNPKYAKAVYNLGVTYFRQKRYIKAIRYYFKAKKVDKEYVAERKDTKKSERELMKALEEDPDNKVLQYLLKKANEEENY